LARYQYLHAGGLDVVDMDKNIGATAIGRDEAISTIRVEEFHPPTRHAALANDGGPRRMINVNAQREHRDSLSSTCFCNLSRRSSTRSTPSLIDFKNALGLLPFTLGALCRLRLLLCDTQDLFARRKILL
jgi:hypothetical protein